MTRVMRHRQVDDGQHHENERLQRDDQQVKYTPYKAEDELGQPGTGGAQMRRPTLPQREQRNQNEYEFTGVHVSEKTQSERNRLGDLLDGLEYQVEPGQPDRIERMQEELAGVAADALDLDAVVLHQQEHAEGHAECDIEIGGRHGLEEFQSRGAFTQRHHVDRQQIERIHEQDEAEDRDRQRRDQRILDVKAVFDLCVDGLDQQLGEALEAARRQAGAAARAARGEVEADDEQQPQPRGNRHAIEVQAPERATAELPVPIA